MAVSKPQPTTGLWPNEDRVVFIKIELLEANPQQPRRYRNPDAQAVLRSSIERYGILQPLIALDRGQGPLLLLSGHRRLEVARDLGLREVPVLIVELNMDSLEAQTLAVAANEQDRLTGFELFWVVVRITHSYYARAYDPALTLEKWLRILRYTFDPKSQAEHLHAMPPWLIQNHNQVLDSLKQDLDSFGLPVARLLDFLARYAAMLPIVQAGLRAYALTWSNALRLNGWLKRARRTFRRHPKLEDDPLGSFIEEHGLMPQREFRVLLDEEWARLSTDQPQPPKPRTSPQVRYFNRLYRLSASLTDEATRQGIQAKLKDLAENLQEVEATLAQAGIKKASKSRTQT